MGLIGGWRCRYSIRTKESDGYFKVQQIVRYGERVLEAKHLAHHVL